MHTGWDDEQQRKIDEIDMRDGDIYLGPIDTESEVMDRLAVENNKLRELLRFVLDTYGSFIAEHHYEEIEECAAPPLNYGDL